MAGSQVAGLELAGLQVAALEVAGLEVADDSPFARYFLALHVFVQQDCVKPM